MTQVEVTDADREVAEKAGRILGKMSREDFEIIRAWAHRCDERADRAGYERGREEIIAILNKCNDPCPQCHEAIEALINKDQADG